MVSSKLTHVMGLAVEGAFLPAPWGLLGQGRCFVLKFLVPFAPALLSTFSLVR